MLLTAQSAVTPEGASTLVVPPSVSKHEDELGDARFYAVDVVSTGEHLHW